MDPVSPDQAYPPSPSGDPALTQSETEPEFYYLLKMVPKAFLSVFRFYDGTIKLNKESETPFVTACVAMVLVNKTRQEWSLTTRVCAPPNLCTLAV